MKTRYFGEYTERTNNTIAAKEFVGTVKTRKIHDKYYPYFKCEDGIIYDVPAMMLPYTNRNVAIIGRIYTKIKIYTKDNAQCSKAFVKLIVIRVKPLDMLDEDLEDIIID